MRNESRGTTLVPRNYIPLRKIDTARSEIVLNGGPRHSETITAPVRLGLIPSSVPPKWRNTKRPSAERLKGEFAGPQSLRLPAHGLILYRSLPVTTPCQCLS